MHFGREYNSRPKLMLLQKTDYKPANKTAPGDASKEKPHYLATYVFIGCELSLVFR